jgi:predicted secreted hydrolase
MGHLAVTDGERGIHEAAERFSRESVGLSGATGEPLRVWLEDWEVIGTREGFRLRAREGDLAVELELEAPTPPVLQGEEGLSLKGPEPGNASYYYSMPRLPTRGSLSIEGRVVSVEGTSWLDREWSTSVLSPGVVGWDWFAVRLSDGWSMMVYDLRREDGSITEFSHAVLMDPAGESTELSRAEVELIATGRWQSPLDGARYPSGWRISVPTRGLSLSVDPLVRDQEMDLAFRYWEGAVEVRGEHAGREVSGAGFVELTGYANLSSTRSVSAAGPSGGR